MQVVDNLSQAFDAASKYSTTDPAYLADLKDGYASGRYSGGDVQNALTILSQQGERAQAGAGGGWGGPSPLDDSNDPGGRLRALLGGSGFIGGSSSGGGGGSSGADASGFPNDFNPETYGQLNPNLVDFYNNNPGSQQEYGSLNAFLSAHYRNAGQVEGRPYKATDTGGGAPSWDGGGGGGDTSGGGWDSGYTNNYTNPNSDATYALASEQIAYTSKRLTEIQDARKLGDMTGSLTSAEQKMFDDMETSAVDNLKSQTDKQSAQVWDKAIVDLVNRGVLQGTVGQKILGTIGSDSLRAITEGVNTIRGTKDAQMLATIDANKNRAMTWQGMLTQESQGLLNFGLGQSTMLSNENMAAQNRDLQNALGQLNAKVSIAGIQSNEAIAANNQAMQAYLGELNAATQKAGQASQYGIATMQNATTLHGIDVTAANGLALAGLTSNAAQQASLYGLYGNLALAGGGLAAKYGSSWWNYLSGDSGSGAGSVTAGSATPGIDVTGSSGGIDTWS